MDGHYTAKKYHNIITGTAKTGNSISGKRTAGQEKNVPEPWSDSRDFFVHFMPLTLLEK